MSNVITYFIEKESNKYKISNNHMNVLLSSDLAEILDFFLKDTADFKVTWSLFTIIEILENLLPKETYDELINKDKATWNGYKLFSSSGRVFGITYKEHLHDNFYQEIEANLYHLMQFFPDDTVHSALEVEAKCHELLKVLDEMGLHPTKLASAVSIYDESVLSFVELPTIANAPQESYDMMDAALQVGWRELAAVYKVGWWKESWDLDANGGYPSVIRTLPNTSEATYWYSKKYEKCDFAILKGDVTITEDFSPIVDYDGVPYKGTKKNEVITSHMWGFINKYKLGHFDMKEGWFVKYHTQDKPYQKIMEDLYASRGENGLYRRIPKLISTGIGGRLAQEYPDRYGDYFNPLLACQVTTGMSLRLGKMIIENTLQNNVISVTIDGVLFDKNPDVPTGKGLGEWRVEQLESLILSRGFQWHTDRKPGNVTYDAMMEEIRKNPNKQIYNGIFINNDLATNRYFPSYPKTGYDLINKKYQSKAIEIS